MAPTAASRALARRLCRHASPSLSTVKSIAPRAASASFSSVIVGVAKPFRSRPIDSSLAHLPPLYAVARVGARRVCMLVEDAAALSTLRQLELTDEVPEDVLYRLGYRRPWSPYRGVYWEVRQDMATPPETSRPSRKGKRSVHATTMGLKGHLCPRHIYSRADKGSTCVCTALSCIVLSNAPGDLIRKVSERTCVCARAPMSDTTELINL